MRLVETLVQGNGAAMDPAQAAGLAEDVEVPPDGCLRDPQGGAQLLEPDGPPRVDEGAEALPTCRGKVGRAPGQVGFLHNML